MQKLSRFANNISATGTSPCRCFRGAEAAIRAPPCLGAHTPRRQLWSSLPEPTTTLGLLVLIRTNTRKYPWTSALLAHRVRACTHTNFSTVSLLHNVHVDKYNQPGSSNVLVPLSPFRRGELWLLEEQGPDLSPKGQHQGRNHPVRLPSLEFDPFTKHATCPWKDDRLVLSAYTPLRTSRLELSDIDHLVSLGFNL